MRLTLHLVTSGALFFPGWRHLSSFVLIAASLLWTTGALADVGCVKRQLTILGYDVGPADGFIGDRTVKALASFAASHPDFTEDLTYDTSRRWCDVLTSAAREPTAPSTIQPKAVLPVPETRGGICVQQGLAALGLDVGSADGVIGRKTRKAVRQFDEVAPEYLPPFSDGTSNVWCNAVVRAVITANRGAGPDFVMETQFNWTGYRPVEDIPEPIKDLALSSVVQVHTFDKAEGLNYDVVETKTVAPRKATIGPGANYRVLQIETCRRQGLARCPIFPDLYVGTAFINNGRELYSCRHVVNNWTMAATAENNLSPDKISPALWLTDAKGRVLYSSASSEGLLKLSINTDQRLGLRLHTALNPEVKADLLYLLSEFLSLTSPFDLVEPRELPLANVALMPNGSKLFISGYPAKTELFAGDDRDTPGDVLVTSTGRLLEASTTLNVLNSSALATGGMSGGMVTDSNGKAIGIACSSPDPIDTSNPSSTSVILNPAAQEASWKRFAKIPLEGLSAQP